jgi:hypothetical protein
MLPSIPCRFITIRRLSAVTLNFFQADAKSIQNRTEDSNFVVSTMFKFNHECGVGCWWAHRACSKVPKAEFLIMLTFALNFAARIKLLRIRALYLKTIRYFIDLQLTAHQLNQCRRWFSRLRKNLLKPFKALIWQIPDFTWCFEYFYHLIHVWIPYKQKPTEVG